MLKFSVTVEENTKLQEIKIQSNSGSKKSRSSVIIIWTFIKDDFFDDDYDAKIFCYFGRKYRVPKTPYSGIQGYGFRFW